MARASQDDQEDEVKCSVLDTDLQRLPGAARTEIIDACSGEEPALSPAAHASPTLLRHAMSLVDKCCA